MGRSWPRQKAGDDEAVTLSVSGFQNLRLAPQGRHHLSANGRAGYVVQSTNRANRRTREPDTLKVVVHAQKVVAGNARLVQNRAQGRGFEGAVVREGHRGAGAIRICTHQSHVIAHADNREAEGFQSPEHLG